MTNDNLPAAVPSGTFLGELQRLIDASGRSVQDVAAAAGLPVMAFTGAHAGAIRIPATKLKVIAAEIGVDHLPLLRLWLQEFQPWLAEMIDEAMRASSGDALPPRWLRGLAL